MISNPYIIELPKMSDNRGSLTVIENNIHIPFPIRRIFYLYEIPGNMSRGAHAHKECHQFLIAINGTFEVCFTGKEENEESCVLDKPNRGLYIPPGIWASEQYFSPGAVCLVLASHEYDENDYIRDYQNFLLWRNND